MRDNPKLILDDDQYKGLSTQEAARRRSEFGRNEVAEKKRPVWRSFLIKFWAPVPWLLELTIVIQLGLGKSFEAVVMAMLLIVNAALSFVQEYRADRALSLLRKQLPVQCRVQRDGRWQLLPAADLVPGDRVRLRMGDLTPADIELREGTLSVDQAALTGESLPVDASVADTVYAGAIVQRGEATGVITATGQRTRFGKTAELIQAAHTVSHMHETILSIVRALVILDIALVAAMTAFALITHRLPMAELAPYALMLLVASVPAALPATFTLATALGARELAGSGVLVTRLSAIEEAASMQVLACDKTGTITENRISLQALLPYGPLSETRLLQLAALASDEASQDVIDTAILDAAHQRNISLSAQRLHFMPFDPANKRTEAIVREEAGDIRIIKGAPRTIAALTGSPPALQADLERLANAGARVLAVAVGAKDELILAGLLALADPPRADSAEVIDRLRRLGLRVVMITGDGLNTARAIAAKVGLLGKAARRDVIGDDNPAVFTDYEVFAGVFPEDKFALVKNLQRSGNVVGMTGDGVNDAPALKQAEVGVAVANATDVAKAAASLVLTAPGLGDIVTAIECSRRVHRRMLTYTLNKIVKTVELSIFLSVSVMVSGTFVITPVLLVLLLFTNDFVTMSIAADNARCDRAPQRWHIPNLMKSAGIIVTVILVLSFSVLYVGSKVLILPLQQLQTLLFVMLVFTGQGVVYIVREQGYAWSSRPGPWLLCSTLADIVIVSILATRGVMMAAIPLKLLLGLGFAVLVFLAGLDVLKVKTRMLASAVG